ncbi:MAG: family 20 glycosylhydrolase [Bacteroides sp.]|nr:family 20 glycosylhydrolase [Bacteroides sp.]MCM1414198.1 family 20 glycosylhydrolase [Bacteroides sp.]MCM1472020.1 family 20 glycosylhydrolase [Bacteroides sp.]
MKKLFSILMAVGVMATSVCAYANTKANYEVVPLPKNIVKTDKGEFTLTKSTKIVYTKGDLKLKRNAELLAEYLKQLTGYDLKITTKQPKKDAIVICQTLKSDNPDAYTLTVIPDMIIIDGASAAGNFYGIQTLRKSVDANGKGDVVFPGVVINDSPRFAYRGAHFDTSRHYFPVDSIKEFIDMLALHNINKFHWHITDDQGWRLEIKKYPKLTEIGSWRDGTCIGHDFESSDSIRYGGYYTQDEARDIVKYAADRHITVIPEIDMPGHMIAALTAYPELGCTGGPYSVWQRWGVSQDVLCAGNDTTLKFIDDVLTEVVDIFPSEYIHIGGDECPKDRWEECPKCQARIVALGLVDDDHSTAEQKLQSFVMEHAAKTLAGMGRKMIGWDEIIEGGLFPGATVMSWRGVEGAREAAKMGHDAIMTPTNYCYFDYSQSQNLAEEPLGIGGFVSVEKVYSLEPTESLTPEQSKHILGAQANLWTEYISDLSHAQYMELPRLAALSEVQWLQPETKDYDAFTKRAVRLVDHYKNLGYNYATHIFDIQGGLQSDPAQHAIVANLSTVDDAPIYYTLDGSTPTTTSKLYTGPLPITSTTTFKALAIRPDSQSRLFVDSVKFAKSTSSAVELLTTPHSRYKAPGGLLTDGRFGGSSFNTGQWIGYENTPLVAVIDLGSEQNISSVDLNTLVDGLNWIMDARGIKVDVSDDGTNFNRVAEVEYPAMTEYVSEIRPHHMQFAPTNARYVKVTVDCETKLPEWHGAGAGKPGFLFVDEIVVD